MAIRHWLGVWALGVAVALPPAVLAQDATTKNKTTSKVHKSGDKTKGGSAGGKATGKTKSSAGVADESVTDSWITMKIKTAVTNESSLKASDITVETKNNVVTLTGTVASEAGKARAEQIAKQTQGVTKVIDNLTVKGNTPQL
jgi:hyperosmotically inducible periplasmic protein